MIATLRQRHRRTFFALGIILPVAFIAGIAARQAVPAAKNLPPEFSADNKATSIVWERADLFGKAPVTVQFLRATDKAVFIRLTTDKNFVKPDLLVYWAAENQTITDTLPANATLLGTLAAAQLPVSETLAHLPGVLVLFSLADSEIVDVSKPVTLETSTP